MSKPKCTAPKKGHRDPWKKKTCPACNPSFFQNQPQPKKSSFKNSLLELDENGLVKGFAMKSDEEWRKEEEQYSPVREHVDEWKAERGYD